MPYLSALQMNHDMALYKSMFTYLLDLLYTVYKFYLIISEITQAK